MISNVVPLPKNVQLFDGKTTVSFAVYTSETAWQTHIDAFCDSVERLTGKRPANEKGGIELCADLSLEKSAYTCNTTDGIVLSASDSEGACYALSTALQAFEFETDKIASERAVIKDRPDKEYRALMVDLARQWHPVRTVLKYIDVCFVTKLRYLHLHFIDDQAYTLPSKAFPDINNGCRAYSYDDIKAIRDYASQRGVIIIPEFEAPGHASFLTKNYPEVFGNDIKNNDVATVTTESGVLVKANRIVCAGKKECEDGIKALLSEMCEMFPDSPYIHIGGDEANIKAWNYCPHCVKYMKDNGIADEYELYSEFDARVARMVLDMGRTPIVWEGFPKKGYERIPRETIVIAWESHYHMAYDLVAEGFKIINASWQPLYIVPSHARRWGIKEIMNWNVYNWQHWWDKSEAKLNPITLPASDNVLGAQICAWEQTYECEIRFVMENCGALSERLWNVKRTLDDAEFDKNHRSYMKVMSKIITDAE